MRGLKSSLVVILFSIFAAANSHAIDVAEVALLDDTTVELKLNGFGIRSQGSRRLYIGALYVEQTSKDDGVHTELEGVQRLEMRILDPRFTRRGFTRRWRDAINISNSISKWRPYQEQIIIFTQFIQENLTTGDNLLIDYLPQSGVRMTLNGTELGLIGDKDFYRLLLKTWIGVNSPARAFREGVLGLLPSTEQLELADQFAILQPSDERIEVVAGWRTLRKALVTVGKSDSITSNEKPVDAAPKVPSGPSAAQLAAKATAKAALEAAAGLAAKAAADAAIVAQAAVEDERRKQMLADELRVAKLSNDYQIQLLGYLRKHQRYPKMAVRRKIQGYTVLRVSVDRSGNVVNADMELSSEKSVLDKEAFKMLERANPLPAIPTDIPDEEFEFLVPVRFKLL